MASNAYAYTDNDVWNLFANYDDVKEVAKYIRDKYPLYFTTREATVQATRLISERNFTKDDVLNGKADNEINTLYKVEKFKQDSIMKENEERKYISLKPYKEKKTMDSFKKIVSFALAVATITVTSMAIKNQIDKNSAKDDSLSSYIGMLSSTPGSEEFTHKSNIVDKNKIPLENNTYALDINAISEDILSTCNDAPDLFDLYLYDTYYNIHINKLYNMDMIYQSIKIKASNSSNLPQVNERLNANATYLDYVLNNAAMRKLIDRDSAEYQKLANSVQNYKNINVNIESNESPYNMLSDADKENINQIINYSTVLRNTLGVQYIGDLEEQVNAMESQRGLS